MDNYKICIVKRDEVATVYHSEHISDHAAIRRGHTLAGKDDVVEIWRGAQCVYAGRHGVSAPF
ncbi:MAG TPA: hypothetical protein VGM26_09905 [Rhizomicrobium sp.]|jgi:hypothetical protein